MGKFLTEAATHFYSSLSRRFYLYLALFCAISFAPVPTQAQTNIYFEIRNEMVVTNTHYHFDVYMYADLAGTYHNKGQIYVLYDTAAFGSAIVFNGKVSNCPTGNSTDPTCSGIHLDLLNEVIFAPPVFNNDPKYATILNDNGNRLAATWTSILDNICPPSALSHTLVPDTPTSLYHFEVEMKNPAINPNLDFYFPLMVNQQFFSNPSPISPNTNCNLPYGNGGLLPVDLSFFEAHLREDDQVELGWGTQFERNHSHFVIEKKRGEGDFKPLAWVLAKGNSEEDLFYDYTDRSPMHAINNYRLRMVDIDGNISYSPTIEIRMDDLAEAFAIYPIPAQDYLTVEPLVPLGNEQISYQLINQHGQLIQSGFFPDQDALTVPTKSLAVGIYYIRILKENELSFQKRFAKY